RAPGRKRPATRSCRRGRQPADAVGGQIEAYRVADGQAPAPAVHLDLDLLIAGADPEPHRVAEEGDAPHGPLVGAGFGERHVFGPDGEHLPGFETRPKGRILEDVEPPDELADETGRRAPVEVLGG